jgi:hypothetical protein
MVFTATTPTTNPSAKNAVTTKSGQHQISIPNNSNVTLPKFLWFYNLSWVALGQVRLG